MDHPVLPKLPQYRCHKIVEAAKVLAVRTFAKERRAELTIAPGLIVPISWEWAEKNLPQNTGSMPFFHGAEGYIVKYRDDYVSWSPKKEFEAGYALIVQTTIGPRLTPLEEEPPAEDRRAGPSLLVAHEAHWKCPRHGEVGDRIVLACIPGHEGPWCRACLIECTLNSHLLRCFPLQQ